MVQPQILMHPSLANSPLVSEWFRGVPCPEDGAFTYCQRPTTPTITNLSQARAKKALAVSQPETLSPTLDGLGVATDTQPSPSSYLRQDAEVRQDIDGKNSRQDSNMLAWCRLELESIATARDCRISDLEDRLDAKINNLQSTISEEVQGMKASISICNFLTESDNKQTSEVAAQIFNLKAEIEDLRREVQNGAVSKVEQEKAENARPEVATEVWRKELERASEALHAKVSNVHEELHALASKLHGQVRGLQEDLTCIASPTSEGCHKSNPDSETTRREVGRLRNELGVLQLQFNKANVEELQQQLKDLYEHVGEEPLQQKLEILCERICKQSLQELENTNDSFGKDTLQEQMEQLRAHVGKEIDDYRTGLVSSMASLAQTVDKLGEDSARESERRGIALEQYELSFEELKCAVFAVEQSLRSQLQERLDAHAHQTTESVRLLIEGDIAACRDNLQQQLNDLHEYVGEEPWQQNLEILREDICKQALQELEHKNDSFDKDALQEQMEKLRAHVSKEIDDYRTDLMSSMTALAQTVDKLGDVLAGDIAACRDDLQQQLNDLREYVAEGPLQQKFESVCERICTQALREFENKNDSFGKDALQEQMEKLRAHVGKEIDDYRTGLQSSMAALAQTVGKLGEESARESERRARVLEKYESTLKDINCVVSEVEQSLRLQLQERLDAHAHQTTESVRVIADDIAACRDDLQQQLNNLHEHVGEELLQQKLESVCACICKQALQELENKNDSVDKNAVQEQMEKLRAYVGKEIDDYRTDLMSSMAALEQTVDKLGEDSARESERRARDVETYELAVKVMKSAVSEVEQSLSSQLQERLDAHAHQTAESVRVLIEGDIAACRDDLQQQLNDLHEYVGEGPLQQNLEILREGICKQLLQELENKNDSFDKEALQEQMDKLRAHVGKEIDDYRTGLMSSMAALAQTVDKLGEVLAGDIAACRDDLQQQLNDLREYLGEGPLQQNLENLREGICKQALQELENKNDSFDKDALQEQMEKLRAHVGKEIDDYRTGLQSSMAALAQTVDKLGEESARESERRGRCLEQYELTLENGLSAISKVEQSVYSQFQEQLDANVHQTTESVRVLADDIAACQAVLASPPSSQNEAVRLRERIETLESIIFALQKRNELGSLQLQSTKANVEELQQQLKHVHEHMGEEPLQQKLEILCERICKQALQELENTNESFDKEALQEQMDKLRAHVGKTIDDYRTDLMSSMAALAQTVDRLGEDSARESERRARDLEAYELTLKDLIHDELRSQGVISTESAQTDTYRGGESLDETKRLVAMTDATLECLHEEIGRFWKELQWVRTRVETEFEDVRSSMAMLSNQVGSIQSLNVLSGNDDVDAGHNLQEIKASLASSIAGLRESKIGGANDVGLRDQVGGDIEPSKGFVHGRGPGVEMDNMNSDLISSFQRRFIVGGPESESHGIDSRCSIPNASKHELKDAMTRLTASLEQSAGESFMAQQADTREVGLTATRIRERSPPLLKKGGSSEMLKKGGSSGMLKKGGSSETESCTSGLSRKSSLRAGSVTRLRVSMKGDGPSNRKSSRQSSRRLGRHLW